MPRRKIDWERQIGRRLRLRDLHIFLNVVQHGSLSQAAVHLGVSQPAISEVISDLELVLRVRLFDRSPRGVQLTKYGEALRKRGTVVFDELKQTIRDIEFLDDPTTGEVRIGCAESITAALLTPFIQEFSQKYPRVALNVDQLVTPTLELPELRERRLDVVVARIVRPLANEDDDLNVEVLFHDELVVAAGKKSPWSHRRKINLAELANAPWILTPVNSWNEMILAEAFRAHGLDMPKAFLTTFSLHLRANLLATGAFITTLPSSVLRFNAERFSLQALPIKLPFQPWPVAIVTLKNRTLSPVVQLFIDHLRAFTHELAGGPELEKKPA